MQETTSIRHIRRRSRQMAYRPPRSALRPGTASRSCTPLRTPQPPLLPDRAKAALSTTRSPRWTRKPRAFVWLERAYGLMLGLERVLAAPTPQTAAGRSPAPPDRCARGNADRADRGDSATPRRTETETETATAARPPDVEPAELDEEDDDFDAGVVDDLDAGEPTFTATTRARRVATASATRQHPARPSPRPDSSNRRGTSGS